MFRGESEAVANLTAMGGNDMQMRRHPRSMVNISENPLIYTQVA
jgi:hypothetical protein